MAKKSASELISSFSNIVGEDTNEDIIEFMKDIEDSIVVDPYEEKYNQLLKDYRDRFESAQDVEGSNESSETVHEEVHDEIIDTTIDDLMEE
jgi:hypothetical protein